MAKILIVDDEPDARLLLSRRVKRLGHEPIEADEPETGIELLKDGGIDLVLLDFRMPRMTGTEVLREIKRLEPQVPVILVTAAEEAEVAMEAMSAGAYDYLIKPLEEEVLEKSVNEALDALRVMRAEVELQTDEFPSLAAERIVGRSPGMWDLYKRIGQVASTSATVLITGESGTGKELVARAIFKHSDRADREFLTVNCAALTETLLESELFGHEKGAFTGATHRHVGKFERARGGTLFLDEIGEISLQTQVKLLRAIQDKTFERVGGEETLASDIRIITATNRNLMEEVEEGRFREDLYYRLNVVHLHIPPLRDRREDIPELCSYLLAQIAGEIGKPVALLSAEAMQILTASDWPGNIRELRNALTKACLASPTQVILPEHLAFLADGPMATPDAQASILDTAYLDSLEGGIYDQVLAKVEERLISYALNRSDRNQVKAAKLLGVSRNMLRRRMKDFGLLDRKTDDDASD